MEVDIDIDNGVILWRIDDLTNNSFDLIKKNISNICHGVGLADKGLEIHKEKLTLLQFSERYENKSDNQKKGIIGELLTHTLIHEYMTDHEVVSPFFNQEEKSQRKGFDVLVAGKNDKELWITEVKSGENKKGDDATRKAIEFSRKAMKDLEERLAENNSTYWMNAINSVRNATSETADHKNSLMRILDGHACKAQTGDPTPKDANVILSSVLFFNPKENIDKDKIIEERSSIKSFKKTLVMSIQKETYQKVAECIDEAINNAK